MHLRHHTSWINFLLTQIGAFGQILNKMCVLLPRSNQMSYGDKVFFPHAAPLLWNSLPCNIGLCQTVDQFKSKLKHICSKKCTLHTKLVLSNCIMFNAYVPMKI